MPRKISKFNPRNTAIALAVLLVLISGIFYYRHHSAIKNPIIPSTNPAADNNTAGGGNTAQQPAANNQGPSGSPSSEQSGPAPITPYGNFVSNHHPGGDSPTSEASVCNTTAGAVCYIQFVKGGETKKLDARTANANGAAFWYWDVKSAGLNAGSWTITAVASLNGQTKTASDALQLVVQ